MENLTLRVGKKNLKDGHLRVGYDFSRLQGRLEPLRQLSRAIARIWHTGAKGRA